MSSGNSAWIGRKGRSNPKEPPKTIAARGMVSKHPPYASSHLLSELNSCVRSFTDRQRDLAESTGFRAFSSPIHELKFDRQFTTWLMSKVDTMSRSIGVSVGSRLMLFQEDAAMVFGIPFMGKEVWDASLDKSDSMRKKIEDIIGMGSESRTPRQASIKTLKSLAGREISVSEEEVFKVAFSVYIVSMLCDSNNPGDVDSVNFWPAISVASDIHKFNWASYVLDSVF
jgi:hypothetical protein